MTILLLLAAGLVTGAAFAGNADTDAAATHQADNHYLPVLVAVDSKGKVSNVDVPIRLRHSEQRTLNKVIRSLITAPARDRHGNDKASQFLMVFEGRRTDKTDVTTFKYVKARVVQNQKMHWIRVGRGVARNYTFRVAPEFERPLIDRGAAIARQNARHYAPSGNSGSGGS